MTNKDLVCKIYKQLIQLNINKTKQPNQNIGKRPKQAFLQRRNTDGQKAHEKMLNITHYQRNANPNYSEVSFHSYQNVCIHSKSLQWCLTLCDPMDCSLPDSSVHGILQTRILEWVAMPSSRGSSPALAGGSLPWVPPRGPPIRMPIINKVYK